MEVRRLTPLEAERLQNFPDGWTDIGDWTDTKGKKHKGGADAPRYKALGNSIALPYWRWLCKRISAQYERDATMGSLFDGIGGFDICWALVNGEENVRWSSEIEEFPIAVVKKHFGDEDTGEEGDFSEAIKKLNRRRNPEPAETKQPVVFEPGVTSRDSKHVWEDGVAPTIRSNPGDNAPSLVNDPDAPYTLQIRSGKAGGGSGSISSTGQISYFINIEYADIIHRAEGRKQRGQWQTNTRLRNYGRDKPCR